ncbi:aldehyde dehydrogenase [Paenibacillus sediminis]|uniref:Aldehyde dehydrogenase n=1 Tax=Paenibacillus sediminis TaxID=664909 RepID=A0ABS4H5Z3_9BACL|nr:aldehyde dehydrogenase [Paenibacillus sediminis]MBP1937901.1 aldehyde dehydrogenase (NAD+) [Paenibacillus sediminis]
MSISKLVQEQKLYFHSGATRTIGFRLEQLAKLRDAIISREAEIMNSLRKDLNKSEMEAYSTEVGFVLSEIKHVMRHLRKWSKPQRAKTAIIHFGAKGKIIPEPYGVALIISPWNYPFQLAIAPLIGAIAAGNTAILKPSELTKAVSSLLSSLLSDIYPSNYVAVVEGGVEESQELLNQPVDKIFFTGSVNVGKIVMEAASKRLVPVTLELGGKSPCIVHKDASLELAAKRIVFGKYTNAGQTCIAPDYLLVHRSVKDELLALMKKVIHEFYGSEPVKSPNYAKIVSPKHYSRLISFLQEGHIVIGGQVDPSRSTIEPTVIDDITWNSAVMQEEIFGPILPVIEYEDISEVIQAVNARPKPLALYLFSNESAVQELIMESISFGGGCINDTLMHIASPYLPFGGVGESGMGSYHGESSFNTFSHMKSVLKQTNAFDFSFRYPSAKNGLSIIRKVLK